MKSRKFVLIFFLVLAFAVGLTTLQDYAFDENESVVTNEFSSQLNTITVEIVDGVGSGDNES
ncbi:MAG: hypothetical protein IH915_04860 [Thaumarchaeota archaeon]|jgi:hypothetical protein|nr:hypothetical protein [Nitrososphaerota archaeon]